MDSRLTDSSNYGWTNCQSGLSTNQDGEGGRRHSPERERAGLPEFSFKYVNLEMLISHLCAGVK